MNLYLKNLIFKIVEFPKTVLNLDYEIFQVMPTKKMSGRGRKKAVPKEILNDAKEVTNENKDAPSTLKIEDTRVKEKESTVQKRGRFSKKANKIADVDNSFMKAKSVKKITEFFKLDDIVHGNESEKNSILLKENIEDDLVVSTRDELKTNGGKTKSGKRKVAETETTCNNLNSDKAIKGPTKRGRRKVNVEPETNKNMTSEENTKETTENSFEENEISTSKHRQINKKHPIEESVESTNDKSNTQSKNENIEVNEEQKRKLHIGRKRKRIANDSSAEVEKNENEDFNLLKEEKKLTVALKRNKAIDNLLMQQMKEDSELAKTVGGSKQLKKGKRAKPDGEETVGSCEKPAKVPKKESKGQSKKDKMPDVSLIDFSNDSTTSDGKKWNLKLSSWNVNGVRAWLEKDGLNFLKHEAPDVMCFQETKCSDKQLPEAVNVDGYHSYWLAGDKDGYSGVGLLSKPKPLSVKYGIDDEEHDKEGRVITAEYDNFYLVTAYVPNAGRGLVRLDYRMKWDKDFRIYIKKLDEKKPVILCGDLNVAHEEIDLANPKTNKKNAGFTKEEREGFSTLLTEGFIDSFRYLYPDVKAAYTFWTYMMNARAKNVGWRLDYFVMSKRFVDHLCDNVIRKDVYGSDHCPITLLLSV